MKKIRYIFSLLILASFMVSCDDYLTVLPENNQSSDEYWRTKEEVEAVLGAGYVKLRDCQEFMFLWGEARGNSIFFNGDGSDGQKAAQTLRRMDILPTNKLAAWDKLYAVINMANSVIKFGPDVVGRDESFNVNAMNSFLSEAYFQRSLAYFYLVRNWKDVPFVTAPYVNDEAKYIIAQTAGDEILKQCLVDLNNSLESAKELFPETTLDNPINTKGRATRWAIYSLIADINLWLGNYDATLSACQRVIDSRRVGLISGNLWFSNFYPGNSNESIFEIQYTKARNQTNSFLDWFDTKGYYTISPYALALFQMNETDYRGLNASFDASGKIWKYIGINNATKRSASLHNDQNWIIYRLADIYLMQAEAYIMKGGDENLTSGLEIINAIRNRAGLAPDPGSSNQLNMLTLLLQERQREFFAEGKCWYDILRVGRRQGAGFKDLLIDQVTQVASASNKAMIKAKLNDPNSWYLPIHADELTVNSLLVQNPYYNNLSK